MRIPDTTIEKLLGSANLATPEQIQSLKEAAAHAKLPLQDIVIEQQIATEDVLVEAFAKYAQIPYVELNPQNIPSDILTQIPERVARQYNAVLFKVDEDGTHHLAMEDPDDVQAVNFLQKEIGINTKIYIATHDNIQGALENYRGDVNQELTDVVDLQREEAPTTESTISEQDIAEDSPIAQTVNLLLEYAIRSHASDVHIEPREDFVRVRYRIDGVLREVNRLPSSVMGALISRIKILANLKIDEHRVPQDGRFKITVGGKSYALRVSSMPITDGEKIAMRILDESTQASTLEGLGYWGYSLKTIKQTIIEPNGMVLLTGPTGSGKSTSLFSILSILNTPEVNISTIEDPVEYKILGVNQTQANPKAGMTFANGLRAMLRQDPNIIMVGEIRDSETADLAIQAALTGHMVFSTLHTNNAAGSLPRLLDMNIEPFLIASTVRSTVGQRLVRRLHAGSRQAYTPTAEEQQELVKLFGLAPESAFKTLHELEKQAAAEGIGGDTPLSTDGNGILKLYRADANFNDDEASDGFKGRIGIYETLYNSPTIQKMIIARATSTQLQDQAVSEGMMTMLIDGLIKALRGETTVEEVLRVSRE